MYKTPSMQDLLEAGVHFGHQVRRGNPNMRDYIYGAKDGVHIINLESSEKLLKEALEFVYELGKSGLVLLFVGTKKQAQPLVEAVAKKANAPYITAHWVGGLLTNFDEIRKNIQKLIDLKTARDKGELTRYTKKEQLLISRKLTKFETELGGVEQMDRLPSAIFITDGMMEKTALFEANRVGMKVVGIADSNSNPSLMDYPIPGNDDAIKALTLLINAVGEAYLAGLEQGGKDREKVRVAQEKKEAKDAVEQAQTSAVEADIAVAEELMEKKALEEASRKNTETKEGSQ